MIRIPTAHEMAVLEEIDKMARVNTVSRYMVWPTISHWYLPVIDSYFPIKVICATSQGSTGEIISMDRINAQSLDEYDRHDEIARQYWDAINEMREAHSAYWHSKLWC